MPRDWELAEMDGAMRVSGHRLAMAESHLNFCSLDDECGVGET